MSDPSPLTNAARDRLVRDYFRRALDSLTSNQTTDRDLVLASVAELNFSNPILLASPLALMKHLASLYEPQRFATPLARFWSINDLPANSDFTPRPLWIPAIPRRFSQTLFGIQRSILEQAAREVGDFAWMAIVAHTLEMTSDWLSDFGFLLGLKIHFEEFPPKIPSPLEDWLKIVSQSFMVAKTEKDLLIVERPTKFALDENFRLHSEVGPAVQWADSFAVWAIHGVIVPQLVVESPQSLTCYMILVEPNTEIRRIMIERMGFGKFVEENVAILVSEDDLGRLWHLKVGRQKIAMLEVINSTTESDGSHKHYFLRVPPAIETSRNAVAWTFGLEAQNYYPLLET